MNHWLSSFIWGCGKPDYELRISNLELRADMESLGRTIVIFGLLLVIVGGLLWSGGRFFGLGHLPGDIVVSKPSFSFYFPIATCIVISLVLTFLANFFLKR